MKTLFTVAFAALLTLSCFNVSAQTSGSISGYVYNQNDSLSIPGAYVIIETGQKKYWATTDAQGFFRIKPVEPGTYSVLITYSGLDSLKINNIGVTSSLDTYIKKVYLSSRMLTTTVITYKEDLIDEDGGSIIKMDHIMLDALPQKGDMLAVLKYVSSDYFVSERTNEVHFRGSRAGTSAYYIDGMRVEGMTLPGMGVGSMQVYSGGVPARFGDFTGGVIEVETKSYNDGLQEQMVRYHYVRLTDAPKYETVKKEEKPETEESTETEKSTETKTEESPETH